MFTKVADSSQEGDPYEARFPHRYGNVCTRLVRRPEVISTYFKYTNEVDLHNQARQFDAALEKSWLLKIRILGYIRI